MSPALLILLFSAQCHARGPLPDSQCTPGATRTVTVAEVCKKGSSSVARNVTEATKRAVVASYGLKTKGCGKVCEVDHLISLELGGSNDPKNLWPEPYEPRPGAHEKDLVENHLHAELCAGHMTLAEVQKAISTNWLAVYQSMNGSQRARATLRR